MATTFNRSIQEDFGGMFGIAPNITSGANRRIEIMSRYSSLGADHDAIQNYDQINMHLSNMYATRDSKALTENGNILYWAPDLYDNQEYVNRGGFDRYYWAGAFVERTSGNVFTHTTIDGVQTDGYAMIPSPYKETLADEYTNEKDNMDSIRLKIKSNSGIPANKFVPLFGYAIKHIDRDMLQTENQAGYYYKADPQWRFKRGNSSSNLYTAVLNDAMYPKGASIPTAIASDDNNLYGFYSSVYKSEPYTGATYNGYPYQSDGMTRNTIVWVMYAHDGNGNGTLATTAGEPAADQLNVDDYYKMRPSNAYYGDRNGYFQWVQPYWMTERLFQNSQTLTQIWNQCVDNGDWYDFIGYTGSEVGRTNFRRIYTFQGEDFKYSDHIVNGGALPTVTDGGNLGIGWLGNTYGDNAGQYVANYQWTSAYNGFQMIAHGPVSNSTLSQETEIVVNFQTLFSGRDTGGRSNNHLNTFGINDELAQNVTLSANHGPANSIVMTGKILDFVFRDIPTIMYYDWWVFWQSDRENFEQHYKPMRALVLRPTFEADTEYSSFSISNYGNDLVLDKTLIGGDVDYIKNYYRSHENTEYVFGNGGFSYDPLANAKANPGTTIEDPTNSWDNPENLINNDLTLRANVNAEGIANALYIQLSGTNLFPGGANASDYEITGFNLNIRGVTLSALDYHNLRFAIVDSTKTTTLFSTNDYDLESLNINDVPINNLTQSPTSDGAYSVYFVTSVSEPHYYSDIQNGYLKIWVETQNTSGA